MKRFLIVLTVGASLGLVFHSVNAATFPNVAGPGPDLPNGAVSFADSVTSFAPGIVFDVGEQANVPFPAFLDAGNTLGIPDVTQTTGLNCFFDQTTDNCLFASLGVGGILTVEFVDNRLTGSGDAADDLWIYEIGPDIEDTFVAISMNGSTWIDVGKVTGSTKGVDLDAFGFGTSDLFRFVRLTDDAAEGNQDGVTVGADIDAIAAISTTAIPIPAAVWLYGTALGLLGWLRRKSL